LLHSADANFDQHFTVVAPVLSIPSGLGKIISGVQFYSGILIFFSEAAPLASALTSFLREVGQFAKSQVHFACEVALTMPMLASG